MTKIWIIAFLFSIFCFSPAKADEYGKFYEDVLISSDVRLNENAENAKNEASSLLDRKAPEIKIEGQALPFRSQRQQPVVVENTATKYGEGPFGLSWGGNYNQIKAMGVELERVNIKDYANSFIATHLPKPLPDIREVVISFGEDNLMWRVLAYGKLLDDDADADNEDVKPLFDKEFFTPKITIIEKTVKDQFGRDQIEKIRREEPMGGSNFLNELKNGEATLYATFEDSNVGAALAVNVDGNGKSYIIIDFTNLQIFKEREAQTLDAL